MNYSTVITTGDPFGIGPVIIAETFREKSECFENSLVVGDYNAINYYLSEEHIHLTDGSKMISHKLNLMQSGETIESFSSKTGRSSAEGGARSYGFLETALGLIRKSGNSVNLVTLPICKDSWRMSGIFFPGHTEYLAERAGIKDYAMIFASDIFHVVLITIHVALKEACNMISEELVYKKIKTGYKFMCAAGMKNPSVGVCGLNPHASENSMFGNEEEKVIIPALKRLQNEGMNVYGPFPADTLFLKAKNKEYNMIAAMYHDQGLIPIKLMDFSGVVNITGGLPFWRISVSHGTAFDITGKKTPDTGSFISALKWASMLKGEDYA